MIREAAQSPQVISISSGCIRAGTGPVAKMAIRPALGSTDQLARAQPCDNSRTFRLGGVRHQLVGGDGGSCYLPTVAALSLALPTANPTPLGTSDITLRGWGACRAACSILWYGFSWVGFVA